MSSDHDREHRSSCPFCGKPFRCESQWHRHVQACNADAAGLSLTEKLSLLYRVIRRSLLGGRDG